MRVVLEATARVPVLEAQLPASCGLQYGWALSTPKRLLEVSPPRPRSREVLEKLWVPLGF